MTRKKTTERPHGKMIVTVVLERELLREIDDKARTLDMNRSQWLRRLVRKDLNKEPLAA